MEDEELKRAVEAAERATALAERYGLVLIQISQALREGAGPIRIRIIMLQLADD